MIGAIAGDVIGSVYEWRNTKSIDFPLFTKPSFISKGSRFTDDTVLTMAVADCILNNKPFNLNLAAFGRKYPDAGFGKFFKEWMYGTELQPYGSFGNGSAMRISPVGFAFGTLEETLRVAKEAASATHNSEEGIRGAQSVASAIFLARNGQNKADIKQYIETTFGYNLDFTLDEIRPTYSFEVRCDGSVPQAIRAFLEGLDYETTIRLAISIGGDTDTIACMAGGVAAAFYQSIPNAITEGVLERLPQEFIDLLEAFEEKFIRK
ncbi:MAG: ADP-ribosylglycohydrolase family protein [Saprospiraceae bacterium]|nr:ADP-ribosylglycohydrolase family protein [Saprospiraceae bacterium]